jgi:hypothetical protein
MTKEKMIALDENIVSAINNFLFSVTVPIFFIAKDIVDQKATGTFFEIKEFLITANHLFDEIGSDTLAVPKVYYGKNQLQLIGKSEVSRPKGSHAASIDIAIVELLDPDAIAVIKKGWQLLGLENVSQPTFDGDFLLSGFPSNRIKKVGWPAAGFTDTELRCFDGTGGFKWKERSIRASSSLRR